MSLINELRSSPILQPFIKNSCSENGMAASISPLIAPNDIIIISPDDYFNSSLGHRLHAKPGGHPPKSPDCLVVLRCNDGTFSVFIIELRNGLFEPKDIHEKFRTCLHIFMQDVLGEYFNNTTYTLNRIKLFFVSDPHGKRISTGAQSQYSRGPKMDALLTLRPFIFDGRRLGIEPHIYDPLITPC